MGVLFRKSFFAALLGSLLFSMGCDGCKEQVKSLVYKEVDRTASPGGSKEQDEGEELLGPNDVPERARAIAVRREMKAVKGSIDARDQVGWYSLERAGDEDWILEITVSPAEESFDPAIYLEIDEEGGAAPLLYDVAGPGEAEVVPMVRVPAGGRARFFVAGASETRGNYRVDIRRRLLAGNIAIEPNDIPELATVLEVPGEVQGFYERPFDRDIFFVSRETLEAGIYSLEVSHLSEIPQQLQVFNDKSLERPLLSLDVGTEGPAIIPNISLNAGEGEGLYFVLSAGELYSREQSYRLRILKHPVGEGYLVEREPNDVAEAAQRVELGQRLRGYLHTAEDRDRFRFVIGGADSEESEDELSEDRLSEDRLSEEEGALEGEVLGADDEEQEGAEEQPVVDPWEAVPEKVRPEHIVQVWLRPLGDAHRLAMRWLPDVESGERSLEIEAEDEEQELVFCNHILGPGVYDVEARAVETQEGFRIRSFDYELELKNIAGESALEIEPNDSLETADRLLMGEHRVGYISTPGDVDYYAFIVGGDEGELSVEAEGELSEDEEGDDGDGDDGVALAGPVMAWEPPAVETVQVQLRGNRLNLSFELLDDEGGRVANVGRRGPGGDEELIIDLPRGLYYLAVRASRGSLCEPYEIEINMR